MIVSSLILYQILLASTLFVNKILLTRIAKHMNAKDKWRMLLDLIGHINVGKTRRIFGDNSLDYERELNLPNAKSILLIHEEPVLFQHDNRDRNPSIKPFPTTHYDANTQQLDKYKLLM